MKLLAKSPDDRYQSAEGLLYDLNQCRAALRTEGVIPDFVIGGRDFSSTLHLPDDLFGREDQKQTLQRLVRSAVSGQSSIALVMGEPGIGKSALVASCLTDVFSARGVVLNGRFDSLGRDRPYHGIRQAIQSVVNQMMGESEELLSETRTRLVADVAEYASVLVSAFQELSEILQSEGSGNMSGAEFDRQLEEGFVRLLTSLAGGGPVVLALDDVQWADHASRRLISRMLSRRNMGSLLCLLSVREQEIDPLHPVLQIMKEQDNEHTVVIRLGPLSEEDIFEILTRTLRTEGAPVRQLATLLRAKTEGNPFFLRQYLRDLGNDGTLKAIDGKWVWDYSAIQSRSIADNVIDLVVTKILYEKGEAQSLLKLISCLGSRAPVDLLAISTGRTSADLEAILEPLVRNGFLVLEGRNVSFVHDRVREAAHTLMTDDERSSNHLVLGRALLRDHTIIGDAEYTIPAVLNPVMHLLNPAERLELARLNLAAGSRARSGGAFSEAGRYFSQGYSLIEDANWDTDYELSFALALGLAESSYLNEEHAKAVDLFQVCSGRARDPLDSARVQELRALLLLSEGKLSEAIDAGLTGLDTLGIRLPRHPGQMGPLPDLIACRLWFVRRKIEDLSYLKDASDSRIRAAMHLMMIIGNAAFIGRPALVPVVIARMVRISLRYGFFEETTFAIVMFGLIIYALGDPSSAIRFGATGAAMLSRVKSKEITGKVLYIHACFIRHLSEHGGKSIEAFLEGYSYSVTAGDTQFQSYNANHYCIQHLLYGGHFGEALEQFSRFTTLLEQAGNFDPIQYHKAFKQFAKYLTTGGQNVSTSLEGADFDVATAERKLKESGSFTVLFPIYMLQGVLELLSGNYAGAIERFTEMRKFESGALGMPFVPHSCMFESLAALDYASLHSADRDALIRRARKLLKRLKTWSKLGPENYLHKALLVEGAIAEARDEIHRAFELYDHAIERSLEGGFVFEAALASERAGKMYRRIGRERLSRIYASSAHDLFQRCG
ncbi:MAG TPA: AAA family ATPase, partial [Leptospiraceae bacterium]|nr:AAA family ATPase [Leptospiraceae bacterium]